MWTFVEIIIYTKFLENLHYKDSKKWKYKYLSIPKEAILFYNYLDKAGASGEETETRNWSW